MTASCKPGSEAESCQLQKLPIIVLCAIVAIGNKEENVRKRDLDKALANRHKYHD